jgi:hypothetical protein
VREDADEHAAFAAQKVAARHTPGFDLPGGDPRRLQRLQAVFAERHVLPRVALPFILPRWLLRNFTRLGIIGINHLNSCSIQLISCQLPELIAFAFSHWQLATGN